MGEDNGINALRCWKGEWFIPLHLVRKRYCVKRETVELWGHLGRIKVVEWVYGKIRYARVAEIEAVLAATASGQFKRPKGVSRLPNPTLRRLIWERDGYCCRYCGTDLRGRRAHTDHVVPFICGGPSTLDNLVTCCPRCNIRKGDRTPEEAGMALLLLL